MLTEETFEICFVCVKQIFGGKLKSWKWKVESDPIKELCVSIYIVNLYIRKKI